MRGERVVPRPRTPLCLGVQGVGRVLDHKDEDQVVKSSSPPRNGVRGLLIILLDTMEYAANLILAIECAAYSQDRGQEVHRVLHCKEERKRRSSLLLILYLAMEYTSYSSSSIS